MRTLEVWLAKMGTALVLAFMVSPEANGRDCNVAIYAINEAGGLFRILGRLTDVEEGKSVARRLQRVLDDAAVEASECECEKSASKLDAATVSVRRARTSETRKAFFEQINEAVDAFNVAVAHMEICVVN